MKIAELAKTSLYEEIQNINENNINSFIETHDCDSLFGNYVYTYISDGSNYYCLGEKKAFNSLEQMIDYLNEKYDDCLEPPTLCENLAYAKFRYVNNNGKAKIHDPKPKVLVLDNDYTFNGKGQIKPGRHDVLAFNLHYAKKFKPTKEAIQSITSFAHLLKKDKQDIYHRIKEFYPEALECIRAYKPVNIEKLKMKNGWFWKRCSVADLTSDEENEWL